MTSLPQIGVFVLHSVTRRRGKVLEHLPACGPAEHNECARANLDATQGKCYTCVLPDFNADGTHGPVGPQDVPWGIILKEKEAEGA